MFKPIFFIRVLAHAPHSSRHVVNVVAVGSEYSRILRVVTIILTGKIVNICGSNALDFPAVANNIN